MTWREGNFRLAYQTIQTSRTRSAVTMFGIIVGVMAVVLTTCIGEGIKRQISGQLAHYGADVLSIEPGTGNAGKFSSLTGLGTASTVLTGSDYATVQKTPGITEAVPLAITSGSVRGDHTVNAPTIIATTAGFADIINHPFQAGGFFDTDDNSRTVVLGYKISQKLFDANAPLGQGLIWRGQRFTVAGVYDYFNAAPFSLEASFDDAIFVPYTTAQQITGSDLGIYEILARSSSAGTAPQAIAAVSAALTAAHGGAHDVTVGRASATRTASDQAIHLLSMLVTAAAVIALIVGGVGIMNVMLVSVTERMHEVGIRKAIGATNQQILRQFVTEAFVLSTIGAVTGVAFSAAAIGLLRLYASVQAVFVWQIMVVAPLIAIAIGVFFGTIPAIKAARKDPIEALRHE